MPQATVELRDRLPFTLPLFGGTPNHREQPGVEAFLEELRDRWLAS